VAKKNEGTPPPEVEFDPQHAIVPFPNNLVLDPTTGKVNLPMSACEPPALTQIRTGVLNQLDGFGTYETVMTTTMTAAPDPATAVPSTFAMYKIAEGTTEENPIGAPQIPLDVKVTQSIRFTAGACNLPPGFINTIALVPMVPLDQRSTYVVIVKSSLKPASGGDFYPSALWSLVRQAKDPVTLDANGNVIAENTPLDPTDPTDANGNGIPDSIEQLRGIDQLWKAHAAGLGFIDATGAVTGRDDILVAWTFTTQTTTDPLDPTVANSPAQQEVNATPAKFGGFLSLVKASGAPSTDAFLSGVLGAGNCAALGCANVGDVLIGAYGSPLFQVLGPNPLSGGPQIPGQWDDPVHPTVQDPNQKIYALVMIPAGPTPAAGWPTVIFGHGLGGSKENLFAFGPQLASTGFASVAIDFQAQGMRAVKTSNDPALGCAGKCSTSGTDCTEQRNLLGQCEAGQTCCAPGEACVIPTTTPPTPISPTTTNQCYAPILSTSLGTTRDNIRQTVLDLIGVTRAARACGAAGCPSDNGTALAVDAAHVDYAGISLGGIIGSTTSSVAGFQGSLLSVPAVGWLDIVENTQTVEIKCPIVNALIDLGVLMGTKWDPAMPTVGLCLDNTWTTQPGYQLFAPLARWILDPADGANFTKKLAMRKFLIQEVVGDMVVPNVATDREGALVGLAPMPADPFPPGTTTASAAITTDPTASKWVRYTTLPASDPSTGGFGNLFAHASLLRPAPAPGHCANAPMTQCTADTDCPAPPGQVCVFPGVLGTARMQRDGLTFLFINH
jgi:hypothetical protein